MQELLAMLSDPLLGGTSFFYTRAVETVNKKGRSENLMELYLAKGNIQPAPGKERELLEEGERDKASILIFTSAKLAVDEDKTKADRVYYNSGVYKVSFAETWHPAGFTKIIAVYERKMTYADWEIVKEGAA